MDIRYIHEKKIEIGVDYIMNIATVLAVFSVNSPFLYVISAVVIGVVIAMSVYYILRYYRHGIEINIPKEIMRKTIVSTILFSIAPSFAVLVGLVAMSDALGIPFPWLRLSVLGAVTYELPAAVAAILQFGESLSSVVMTPEIFSTVTYVMTFGIVLPGMILIPFFLKKIVKGFESFKKRDKKWGDILSSALFIGMICAFLGMVVGVDSNGHVALGTILTLVTSAALMLIIAVIIKKFKAKWLENYALAIAMLGSMALTVLYAYLWPSIF